MRFISHLDLMRLLVRAMRRADLPLKLTEGFNPHPKLSMQRALKLGVESGNESASIVLKSFLKPDVFVQRMREQLPGGIRIVSAALK